MQPPPEVKKLKVCIVGDSCIGKTAFSKVWAEKEYPDSYEGTVGSDHWMRNLQTYDGNF